MRGHSYGMHVKEDIERWSFDFTHFVIQEEEEKGVGDEFC